MREKGTNGRAFLRGDVVKYTWVSEGSSYTRSDTLAAALDGQLDKWERIPARAAIAGRYRAALWPWAAAVGVGLPQPEHRVGFEAVMASPI